MSPRQFAGIAGIIAAAGLGFFILGNSRGAGGAAKNGGLTAAPAAPGGKQAPKGPPPVPVLVATAATRDMRQVLEISGSLKTDDDVRIGSRIAGRVVRVSAKEGDHVTRGEVLVQLDDRELRAEIARARGTLASAQSKLSLSRNQSTWKDTAARSDYQTAQANLKAAQAKVQQAQTQVRLVETQTRLSVETANSGVHVATERLSMAREATRKQELRQAQLAVDQAAAAAQQARVDADNARLMYERRQKLLVQDAIAKEEVEESGRRYKSAEANQRVAEKGVDVARQKLDLAREGSRAEEVRMAEQTLFTAQQNLEQAKSDQQKQQVVQGELEDARSAQRRAESAVKAAQAGLVQTRLSQDDISAARAAIRQAAADIQVYQAQLADLTIKAPVSGVVSTRTVNPGEMVAPGSVLMDLVALDTLFFEALVPELEISLLRPGATARVTIGSLGKRQFPGTVREIIPVADKDSRGFRVRVAVVGGGGQLLAGGYARAVVAVGNHPQAVTLPKEALHTEAGDKFVWLVANGPQGGSVAHRQSVKSGLIDARFVEILSGLRPGQQVIVSGSPAIIEGTPVTVAAR